MARIEGNRRDNSLSGTGRDDKLFGRGGDDTLRGGKGDDEVTGGRGRDVFEFAEGHDRDTIRDFEVGRDKVDLEGFEFDDFVEVLQNLDQKGDDVVLRFGDGDRLRFEDVDVRDFTIGDFTIGDLF